jgi:hypothetical protein
VTDVSSPLSGFTYVIDNPARRVITSSSAPSSDNIAADTPLITFTLTAKSQGTYTLSIKDGDGTLPDDLVGPIPPGDSVPYSSVGHILNVVPEPGTGLLLVTGLIGLAINSRRSRARGMCQRS